MSRVLAVGGIAALLSACFNFQQDLATCVSQGRCGDGGASGGGGGGGAGGSSGAPDCRGVATGPLCDRGVCWEAPVPTTLGITAVAAASVDDWWFGTSSGTILRRDHCHWSMAIVGERPVGTNQLWNPVTGLAMCGGSPWASIINVSLDQSWVTLDGGQWGETGDVLDPERNNHASVYTSWTGPGGECAFGGEAQQGALRPWLAYGAAGGAVPSWELPEISTGQVVSAIGGTRLASLWVAVNGTAARGLWQHQADGGFTKIWAIPSGLSGDLLGVCESSDGGVYVSGASGIARADATGGTLLSGVSLSAGLECTGPALVASGSGGVVSCDLASGTCAAPTLTGREFQAQGGRDGVVVAGTAVGEVFQVAPSSVAWSSGERRDLFDVWVDESGHGYAVGDGVVLFREDGGWRTVATGDPVNRLFAVVGLGDGGVLAVGDQMGVTLSPNDVRPTRLRDPSGTLVQTGFEAKIQVAAPAPDGTAWAAGQTFAADFRVLHYAGDAWNEVVVDAGVAFPIWSAMTFARGGEGWAAGNGATVWHYAPSRGWAFAWQDPHGDATYLAVAEAGGVVWVAGTNGRAARFTGGSWSAFFFPDSLDEIHLLYAAGGTFHAVGKRHRYSLDTDGTTWLVEAGLPIDFQRSMGRGVVVGARGFITGQFGAVLSFPR